MSKFVKSLSVIAVAGAVALVVSSTAEAQGRRGGGSRGGGTRVIVAGPYYSPFFYSGWYGYPFAYPFGYPYPPYGYGRYEREGSLRLQVEPRQAEVFVDGYYAGVVDDFDGAFQRLRVEPGEHDVEVYLSGYHSLHQQVYLQVDKTFTIKQTLQPLGPGDQPEPRPVAKTPPEDPRYAPGQREPEMPPAGRRRGGPPPDRGQGDRGQGEGSSLALRVQPGDAEILIDGEPWQGSAGGNRLVIQLAPGDHRIEVRKPGYVSYMSSVRVRPGDATPINISLTRE